MIAIRETPQVLMGFLSFELLYGCQPWGIWDIMKEGQKDQVGSSRNPVKHVLQLREQLNIIKLAKKNL